MSATVGRALDRAARRLRDTGSAALDARRLFAFASGWNFSTLLARSNDPLDADLAGRFDAAVARRERGEPVAYIVGSVGFFGREFLVTPAVLVPRPESEHVVEAALAEIASRSLDRPRIADIGTGSGILAISIACEVAGVSVFASDASAAALEVAQQNARALGVGERVAFLEGDLALPLAGVAPLDVIVANLPYVPSGDVPQAPDPVSFEPRIAVDGGADGLVLYARLLEQLPSLVSPGAALFFEAAPPTIEALAAFVERAFPAAHLEIGEDYAGMERYVVAILP